MSPMSPRRPKSRKAGKARPRWGWSGVSKRKRSDQQSNLRRFVAMLPATRSGEAEVLARLAELRDRFQTWLHQDEFGPTRAEQIAALRAVIKLAGKLCMRLEKGSSRSR